MSDFVVIWRSGPRSSWAVQPRVFNADQAGRLAAALFDQFGGEAQALPIAILEDSRDLEG